MKGQDLREWRKRVGYTQDELIQELGVRSRQTIITWEKSDEDLPRMLELALIALEQDKGNRRMWGKRTTAKERKSK